MTENDTDCDQLFEALGRSERAVQSKGWQGSRVWLGHGERVWLFEDKEDELIRLESLDVAARLPPAITDWLKDPPDEAKLQQIRDTLVWSSEILEDVRRGNWLSLDEGSWMVDAGRASLCRFRCQETSTQSLYPCHNAPLAAARLVWSGHAKPQVMAPPAELRAILKTEVDALVETLDALEAGTHLWGVHKPDKTWGYLCLDERWLSIDLDAHDHVAEDTLFNPWAGVTDEATVIRELLDQRSRGNLAYLKLYDFPDVARGDLDKLRAALSVSKGELVERYLGRLRQGKTVSGGPTSDQSWTLRADGEGFSISAYEDRGEGLRPVVNPISEEEVRQMLERYHLFGLHRLE